MCLNRRGQSAGDLAKEAEADPRPEADIEAGVGGAAGQSRGEIRAIYRAINSSGVRRTVVNPTGKVKRSGTATSRLSAVDAGADEARVDMAAAKMDMVSPSTPDGLAQARRMAGRSTQAGEQLRKLIARRRGNR